MRKLVMVLPLVAGCATAPVSAPAPSGVSELRAEVTELRKEVNRLKGRDALRKFVNGKRVKPQKDLRDDLPKGVAR